MGIGRQSRRSERRPEPNPAQRGLMPSVLFAVDVDDLAGEAVLTLRGELDSWTRHLFVAALADVDDSAARIVLDVSDLTFIDAGSIGLIHRSRTLAGLRGTDLVLRGSDPHVLRILEQAGLFGGAGNGTRPIVLPLPARAYERMRGRDISDPRRRGESHDISYA
jgi:anti-anti-sigma factor